MRIFTTISGLVLMCGLANAQSDLEISGYVDASMTIPVDGADMGFSFDAFEVDFAKDLGGGVYLRADVDFTEPSTHFVNDTLFQDHNELGFGAGVEQAYVTWTPVKIGASGLAVTLGKFNAPIGFELLDAPDMYQYSHSLVFDNALPTNLSGVSVAYEVGAGIDLVAYLANGWDVNFADDSLMIFGGRLGWSGIEGVAVGVSGIQDNAAENFIIDLDATVTMVKNLILGFEFNTGHKDKNDVGLSGWLVMANYAFGDYAVTVRQDAWGDASSTTISPSMSIADGAGMLLEYRIVDDGAGNTTSTAAFEMTFSF